MRDKRDECGCHRDCTGAGNDMFGTPPCGCDRRCVWPNCLTDAEHTELVAELDAEVWRG